MSIGQRAARKKKEEQHQKLKQKRVVPFTYLFKTRLYLFIYNDFLKEKKKSFGLVFFFCGQQVNSCQWVGRVPLSMKIT